MYTNNLKEAIKLCKVHHFADDTYIKKKNVIRTKPLILGKKLRRISEQSQACCPTEHEDKVSRKKHKNKLRCLCFH